MKNTIKLALFALVGFIILLSGCSSASPTLSGRLVDTQNKPLEGVEVQVTGVTIKAGSRFIAAKSDGDGKFVLNLDKSFLDETNYEIVLMAKVGISFQPLKNKDGKAIVLSIPNDDKNLSLDLGDIVVDK